MPHTNKITEQAVGVVDAIVTYTENRTVGGLAVDLWPSVSFPCQQMWGSRFSRGLAYAWGKMDRETRRRFVALAMDYNNKKGDSMSDPVGTLLAEIADLRRVNLELVRALGFIATTDLLTEGWQVADLHNAMRQYQEVAAAAIEQASKPIAANQL